MKVYVLTYEPKQDNSVVLGVFESLDLARQAWAKTFRFDRSEWSEVADDRIWQSNPHKQNSSYGQIEAFNLTQSDRRLCGTR